MGTDTEALPKWEVPYSKLDTDETRNRIPSGSSSFAAYDDKARLVEPLDMRRKYIQCRLLYFALFILLAMTFILAVLFFTGVQIFNEPNTSSKFTFPLYVYKNSRESSQLEEKTFSNQQKQSLTPSIPYNYPSLPPLPPDPAHRNQCHALDSFQCYENSDIDISHDIIKKHQFEIDEALAEELLEEADKLPIFYSLPQAHDVRTLFRKCNAADSRKNQSQLLLDTINFVEQEFGFNSPMLRGASDSPFRTRAFSATNFSRLIGHLQTYMGISTLFHVYVQASDSIKQPFAIYLKINHDAWHSSVAVNRFLHRHSNLLATDFYSRQTQSGLNEIKSACDSVSYPLEYEKWTLNTVNRRWSEINFVAYFDELGKSMPVQLHDLFRDGNFEFFIENPDCFSAFNDLLRTKTVYDRHKFMSNFLAYLILAEKEEYLGNEVPSFASLSEEDEQSLITVELPTRLKCIAQLRHHLPHFTSKLYLEIVEHRGRYKEKISELKSKFHEFYRKLMAQFYIFIENTKGFKRTFALEKLRNVGVTYGPPDWITDIQKLANAHKDLIIPRDENSFFILQIHLERYSFRQKLLQLIEDDEYNLQRPFDKISSANVQFKYSRAGNWLQIPLAVLTLPQMKSSAYILEQMSIGRQMATEVSKATDSDGRWWFSNGFFRSIDRYGPSFSLQATEDCYRNAIRLSNEEDISNNAADLGVLHGLNDIMGITVAFRTLQEELKTLQPKPHLVDDIPQKTSVRPLLEQFVRQLKPYYCTLTDGKNNPSKETEHQSVVKIFLDSLMREAGLFGCGDSVKYNSSKCEIHFDDELDFPLYDTHTFSLDEKDLNESD